MEYVGHRPLQQCDPPAGVSPKTRGLFRRGGALARSARHPPPPPPPPPPVLRPGTLVGGPRPERRDCSAKQPNSGCWRTRVYANTGLHDSRCTNRTLRSLFEFDDEGTRPNL
ncbi:hypothetical protein LX36DRAFT_106412 [Colletotrichum falcatum]|nr:hypothetical protein LX36DRAFT_106412 [Colletotrichum falcatum]